MPGQFEESKHPRANDGKFSETAGGGSSSSPSKPIQKGMKEVDMSSHDADWNKTATKTKAQKIHRPSDAALERFDALKKSGIKGEIDPAGSLSRYILDNSAIPGMPKNVKAWIGDDGKVRVLVDASIPRDSRPAIRDAATSAILSAFEKKGIDAEPTEKPVDESQSGGDAPQKASDADSSSQSPPPATKETNQKIEDHLRDKMGLYGRWAGRGAEKRFVIEKFTDGEFETFAVPTSSGSFSIQIKPTKKATRDRSPEKIEQSKASIEKRILDHIEHTKYLKQS